MHEVTGPPSSSRPAHAARPPARAGRLAVGILAAAAVMTAIGVGVGVLLKSAVPASSIPTRAELITVTPARP